MDFISDPLHSLQDNWAAIASSTGQWLLRVIVYCVLGLCLCVSWFTVPVNEAIHPSLCLLLLSVCLSIYPSFTRPPHAEIRGEGGFSCSLGGERRRRSRQGEEEQERKRIVPKPTRGSDIDERERTSAKLTLQREEEKLDTEGRYTQRGRERKWGIAALKARQALEEGWKLILKWSNSSSSLCVYVCVGSYIHTWIHTFPWCCLKAHPGYFLSF